MKIYELYRMSKSMAKQIKRYFNKQKVDSKRKERNSAQDQSNIDSGLNSEAALQFHQRKQKDHFDGANDDKSMLPIDSQVSSLKLSKFKIPSYKYFVFILYIWCMVIQTFL